MSFRKITPHFDGRPRSTAPTHNLSHVLVGNGRTVPQITVNLSGDLCIDTISQIGSKKLVILSAAKDLDSLNEMAETRFFGFASE